MDTIKSSKTQKRIEKWFHKGNKNAIPITSNDVTGLNKSNEVSVQMYPKILNILPTTCILTLATSHASLYVFRSKKQVHLFQELMSSKAIAIWPFYNKQT